MVTRSMSSVPSVVTLASCCTDVDVPTLQARNPSGGTTADRVVSDPLLGHLALRKQGMATVAMADLIVRALERL